MHGCPLRLSVYEWYVLLSEWRSLMLGTQDRCGEAGGGTGLYGFMRPPHPTSQASTAKRGRWGDEPLSIILGEPCLAPLDLLLWLGAPGMTSRRKDVVCCLR